MQLPFFSHDPKVSAKQSPDAWVKKLSIEAAQLLAACYTTEQLQNAPKTARGTVRSNASHPHHPITKWVKKSLVNFWWAWDYGFECIHQSINRNLVKSAHHKAFFIWCFDNPPSLGDVGLTPPALPKGYERLPPELAYQQYLIQQKNHLAVWSNDVPEWYLED